MKRSRLQGRMIRVESTKQDEARPNVVLAASILASSLAFLDASVVNVGLPTIEGSFRTGPEGMQWVVTAYLLPLSALVLMGGTLGDRFGRGRVFLLGLALFSAGSCACAASPSLPWLVAGRAVQGIGAACLTPNSLAILNDAFVGSARGRAIGIWAGAAAATSGIGPVFGGWLIETIGWRSAFLVNLPLAVAASWMIRLSRLESKSAERVRLDPCGALLATAGLGSVTLGLTVGAGSSGWTPTAFYAVLCGAAGIASFVGWEWRLGGHAMMPLRLFASRDFVALTMLTLFLYGALGALVLLLPYCLMQAGGVPPAAAGAAMLPATILVAGLSSAFGASTRRLGAGSLLAVGCLTVACGFLLFVRVGPDANYGTDLLPALLLIGLGLAAAVAPLTTAVMASVEPRLAGTASGLNNAVARTGGLIATALSGRTMGARGAALVEQGHAAALFSAVACILAAASAFSMRAARGSPSAAGHRPPPPSTGADAGGGVQG